MGSFGRLVTTVVLVVVVVFGSLWFLNNTRLGYEIKCRYFNDVGACLVLAFSEPASNASGGHQPAPHDYSTPRPPSTPDPAAIRVEQQRAIDRAASRVSDDIASLRDSIAGLKSDVASIPSDLKSMAADVAETKKQRDFVASEANQGVDSLTVCSDAVTAGSDLVTVQSDRITIDSDGTTLQSDYTSIESDMEQLQADAADLASARAQLPDYGDSGPATKDIADAIAAANAAMSKAKSDYTAFVKTADGYVAEAQRYADAADEVCNSLG